MKIIVLDNRVLVDGIQNGKDYQTHNIAVGQAQILKDKHYPHAELIIPEVPQTVQVTTPKGTKTIRKAINSIFAKNVPVNLEEFILRVRGANRILNHATLKIESIGNRITNWATGYNLEILGGDKQDVVNDLSWFTGISNEDMSNRYRKTGFNLTKKREVETLMATMGLKDIYYQTLETIKTHEDVHELKQKHDNGSLVAGDGISITLKLSDFKDAVMEYLTKISVERFGIDAEEKVLEEFLAFA